MDHPLLLVSGPPGVGKTTVARAIADARPRGVHLLGDAFLGFIRNGYIDPWRSGSRPQNETVVAAMTSAAVAYANGGYDVALDFVLGPWHLASVVESALRAGVELAYVVLRPTEEHAVGRGLDRAPDELRDEAAIRQLHAQFADLGPLEPHALDTSGQTVAETVAVVEAGLRDGRWRLDPLAVARTLPPRHIAIAIVEHTGHLLVAEVPDPVQGWVGYRPLGGSIEAGETPGEAVVREFREAVGLNLSAGEELGQLDNSFVYLGRLGHENVTVLGANLVPPPETLARVPWVEHRDPDRPNDAGAMWISRERLLGRETRPYPAGLAELLRREA